MGEGHKLANVADAWGKGDGGGPATEQGLKPLRRLTSRVVGIEGEEDAGRAPEGCGDPLDALRAQGSDRRKAPSGNGEPVEEALGHNRPGRGGAETPKTQHRLGAGKRLEPGSPVRIDRSPASQRTRPPEASGTTTMPANRSAPRAMNSPEPRMHFSEKPRDSRACRSPPSGAKPRPRRAAATGPTPREARYSRASGQRRSHPA